MISSSNSSKNAAAYTMAANKDVIKAIARKTKKKKKKRRDKEKEAHPTGNELTVSYATGHIVTDAPGDIL